MTTLYVVVGVALIVGLAAHCVQHARRVLSGKTRKESDSWFI